MRRLLLLALFVALVAGMGYSQVTWGGLFQYGAWWDFVKKLPEQANYGKLMFTDQLDQFNTIVFRFRWKEIGAGGFTPGDSIVGGGGGQYTDPVSGAAVTAVTTPDWDIDRFYISSDVTGALGVTNSPVTLKLGFGYQDPQGADLTGGISPFEVADLSGNDIGGNTQATIYPLLTINKMVNIGAIIAPGWMSTANSPFANLLGAPAGFVYPKYITYQQQGFEVFANGGVPPFMAEVGYGDIFRNNGGGAQWNGEALKFVWVAANWKQTVPNMPLALAVAANAQFNVNSNGGGFMLRNHYAAAQNESLANTDDVNYGYGVAASAVYQNMYTAKVGFVGIEGSAANRAEFQLIAMLVPQFGVDWEGVLNLDSNYTQNGTTPFVAAANTAGFVNDMDIAARVVLGKAMYRIGWKYIDKDALYSVMADDIGLLGDTNGPNVPGQGLFVEMSLSF